jgi:hypothetical protein
MEFPNTPGALKQLRRNATKFERTFRTPLEFVSAIVSTNQSLRAARVTIEQAVFEPEHWIALLGRYSLAPAYQKGTSVTAVGQKEIEELLQTALSDWLDFIFVPDPKAFVIYSDHDEYTTLYANTRSNLNRVAEPLLAGGFQEVSGYRRPI